MSADETQAKRERSAAIERVLGDPNATGEEQRRAYDELCAWAVEHPDRPAIDLIRRYEEAYGQPGRHGHRETPEHTIALEARLASSHEEVDPLRAERVRRAQSPADPALLDQASLMAGGSPYASRSPEPHDPRMTARSGRGSPARRAGGA